MYLLNRFSDARRKTACKNSARKTLLERLESRLMMASDITLDVNAITNKALNPTNVTVIGTTAYFAATGDLTGRELYKTDGTEAGTVLVKDIAFGTANSDPKGLFERNGSLFFSANDGVQQGLWKSNGTNAGTEFVTAINGDIVAAKQVGSIHFLITHNIDTNTTALLRTDGTAAGTVELKSFAAIGPALLGTDKMVVVDAFLFFAVSNGSKAEIWRTNGTDVGTMKIREFPPGIRVGNFVNVNGNVLFTMTNSPTAFTVFKLVPSTNAVSLLKIGPVVPGQIPTIVVAGNAAYVPFSNALFKSNGTNFIFLGNAPGTISELTAVNDSVFFRVLDPNFGFELWKSNGLADGTAIVKDIAPGPSSSFPLRLFNSNGTLYFAALNNQLWKSDGTEAGTVEVASDIGSLGTNFATLGTSLLFTSGPSNLDRRLWISDGTGVGTKEIVQVVSQDSNPTQLTNINNTLYFTADDGLHGPELFKTDGTAEGTSLVKDIDALFGSNPSNLTNVNGKLYFTATTLNNGVELWKSDGTSTGTQLVADLRLGIASSNPASLTNVNGTLFFTADNGTNGRELWKVDASGSPQLVKDIRSGLGSSNPTNLINVNGILYFSALDGLNGVELWKSDGTAAGTLMVKNIAAGLASSDPDFLTNVNGALFFQAGNRVFGKELWKSDGTATGTVLVKDIAISAVGSNPENLVNASGTLFFRANDGTTGVELWKSDGTTAGTVRVHDIASGLTSSNPSELVNVNGSVFFRATDSTGDTELWKSDGTSAGTLLVKNISTTSSSLPSGLVNAAGQLYFRVNSGFGNQDLWQSDGTSAGTILLKNFALGSNPGPVTLAGTQLFLAASTASLGRELIAIDLVDGTAGDDSFILKYGSSPSSDVDVTRSTNGGRTNFVGSFSMSAKIQIDGSTGNDFIRIEGTNTDDTFIVGDVTGGIDQVPKSWNMSINKSSLVLTGIEARTLAGKAGNDIYRFDGDIAQELFQLEESGTGTDTIDLSPTTTVGVALNLGLPGIQAITPGLSLQLLSTSTFENVMGGSGDDTLVGNNLSNTLNGKEGNDSLNGAGGNDTLQGENGKDVLIGSSGNDAMFGGDGDDIYVFDDATSLQADSATEFANQGLDTISFATVTEPVTVDLGSILAQPVHLNRTLALNAVDTFENIEGGLGNDTLTGNVMSNVLNGKGGSDLLIGGIGFDTYLFEPASSLEADAITEEVQLGGIDTISFASVADDIVFRLAATGVQSVHTNRTLKLNLGNVIENVFAGSGNDQITGNVLDNILIGNGGNDQLTGASGRDILIGGLGQDKLLGGAGDDILIGGTTSFDADLPSLDLFRIEWTSPNSYDLRVTNIRTGVGVAQVELLAQVSVLDDGEPDELTGGLDSDWFFGASTDFVTDLAAEILDSLD